MRYLHRKKIIILMYHGFTDTENKGIKNCLGLHLDINKFREQMEYLDKYYNVISLEQLVNYYNNIQGYRLPPNPIVITIDDGYKSNYTLAYPVFKQFNIPATIFIATNFVDKKETLWVDKIGMDETIEDNAHYYALINKIKSTPQEKIGEELKHLKTPSNIPEIYKPLEWRDIKEMIKSRLITIGDHTCSHSILTHCKSETMEKEISLSKKVIEDNTMIPCRLFSYPNGSVGDFNAETKALLKKSGYSCALTTIEGMNDKYSDVFELKRFGVDNREDLIMFIMTLSGVLQFFMNMRHLIKKLLRRF